MNSMKIYLAESGRIADLKKDFPLYQGQFQNKLLNVFVPTSILAPSFTSQSADGTVLADYVASTSVKIGMTYVSRDGSIKVSKNYYMRYLKTLTYQNVEYALYERKLPKEFTLYAGQGQNAPTLIANVVNIQQVDENGTPVILSVITSQTCNLDVMPSTNLDQDESIEPTELENINAQINEINEILPTKQDKVDDNLETANKSVVGAINENKGRIDINTQNIETNRQNIATNRNDIDFLIQNMQMSEEYIGQLRGTTLPSNSQLTQFVRDNTDPSREPKNGDVIIFILEVDGGTDKNYKYFYTATQWQGYEIPPLETASNGSFGIIQGTYGVANYETLVDISGGEILNIYVKDNTDTYRNIKEYLNTTTTDINDILDGTSVVGEAMKALEDGLGNNIVNTYLTKTLGATKQYVRDYAMPREFNDVDFISATGYQDDVPTSPESGIQFTVNTNAVGDFQLFQVQKTNSADFELSSKNGYSNNIYVSASADCVVSFRLTTQYKKMGQDWADLNVELTSPITLTAGNIEKLMFGNPFTYLGEDVISLTDGDLIRQTLEVITQTSTALTFDVYSNEIYPSTFNLTSQSYVLSGIEQSVSRLILLGADGVIEANRVVFEVQNADSYVEFRTNQREFLINGHLPLVGELDDTLPINITFGDTTYNVYSYMKGTATPITIGDLKSNMTYNETTGYSFTSKMIFLETSDYVGFVISPATITAEQLANIIKDTETVVISLDNSGTKLNIQLSADVISKLAKTLVTPMSSPTATELVGVNDQNMQTMIELGNGLVLDNGVLSISLNDDLAPYISYAVSQSLTEEQKALARSNIGAGSSAFSGSYPDLEQKPILNTSNTTSQTEQADEIINGTINLHKVSKTGALADMIQDSTNRTVTDTEKENWNNPQYSSIQNVPQASTSTAGVIQIATDTEAENGTNETKAINPKQLLTAIKGLGSVFTLKGSISTKNDLPATGNNIGDVWYVVDESVGYIWLNDGTTDKWEQLGLPIDLSTYMQFSDVINNLTSDNIDKPLSAYQGKELKALIDSLSNNTTKIKNSNGGFSAGTYSTANYGGAIGNESHTDFGGAVGHNSYSVYGGAIGRDTITGNGFAGGYGARTMTDPMDRSTVIDAVQFGDGVNSIEKSLQIYNDNIYNANTHTLNVQNIKKNGVNVPDIYGYVAGLKEGDTRSRNYPPSYYYELHSLGKNFIVEFKDTDAVGLTDDVLVPSYSPYCQVETHTSWGDKSGGPIVQLAYTYGQVFQRYGEDTWSSWVEITNQITSGINSNGRWVRFSDGTQICSWYFTKGDGVTVTFPNPFIDSEIEIVCQHTSSSKRGTSTNASIVYNISSTSFQFNANHSDADKYKYIAIGRWK